MMKSSNSHHLQHVKLVIFHQEYHDEVRKLKVGLTLKKQNFITLWKKNPLFSWCRFNVLEEACCIILSFNQNSCTVSLSSADDALYTKISDI